MEMTEAKVQQKTRRGAPSPVPAEAVLLIEGRGWQPDIYLVRRADGLAVLKDYSRRGPLVRLVGAFLIRRENAAYQRLKGVTGVPQGLGRVGRLGLLTEFVDAELVTKYVETRKLPAEYFERLYELLQRIHAAGVAHGDLKRRRNLMITRDFQPYIIDFAASWCKGPKWNLLRNWFFRQVCQVDRNAVAKLKWRHAPHLLTEEERNALNNGTFLERSVRILFGR